MAEDESDELSEDEIDYNVAGTFPASDPPSWTLGGSRHEGPSPAHGGEKPSPEGPTHQNEPASPQTEPSAPLPHAVPGDHLVGW